MTETKIMTFLGYKTLFSHVEKDSILIPNSYLDEATNVESLIDHIIKDFDNHEGISFSSFLNAVVQTCDAELSEKLGLEEIQKSQLVQIPPTKGLLFHRENLLFLITRLIAKEKGNLRVTGQKKFKNAQSYYKALLLVNELISRPTSIEKDYFIRAYPYYYIPETSANIYEIRMQRYWHIYDNLLPQIEESRRNILQNGIEVIEKKASLHLKDYFHMVAMIYYWYLKIPNHKSATSDKNFKDLGFDYKNLDSFYVRKANFGENHDLLKLIRHLALDLNSFKLSLEASVKRKNPISGFYANFQSLFDHPVFKINDDDFCIIDLKFLFEGLCSGFIWHINSFADGHIQSVKEQYGYLLELYFVELLKKIFGEVNVQKPLNDGNPDVILETEKYVIVLEFTTEYYLFASLYSEQTDSLKDDLHRLLFNHGKDDTKARGKKEVGKFFKLNGYLEKYKDSKKTVIPVLVTENYLGDFDMLDRFDGLISKGIKENSLENLKTHKPTILNLDDFEFFWQIAKKEDVIDQFATCVEGWEENKPSKGKYHYNFLFFNSESHSKTTVNLDFCKFFNFKTFMENLAPKS